MDLLAVGDEGLPQAGEAGKIAGLIVKIQLDCGVGNVQGRVRLS